jgi:transposase
VSHRTVRTPTPEEREELFLMTQHAVGRVAMRAHMILLSARGYSAYEIAELHDVTDPTVYKWIERFDAEGPEGLYDREREGRPPKVDDEAERELRRVLDASPTDEGYDFSNWTVPRLTEHLERELGLDVHPETVRQALHRLRFSHTRPRRRLPEAPNYAERIAEIDRAIAEVGAETTVLFQDETECRRFPPLRRGWSPVGEQAEVAVPRTNGKFALYGALDVLGGQTIVCDYPKAISEHTESFLRAVLERVEGEILLIWDNASWHTSKAVEAFIGEHDRLRVLPLPARSPEANPIEDVWRVLKNEVAANLERSLEALKTACRRFFRRLTPERALITAGLS